MCESMVDRLALQGRRVTGVHCRSDRGPLLIEAGQVFVCAGAIHSPALLQRSGIGPAEVLSRAGVACVVNMPGVGAGLQDHPMVSVASHLRPFARQGESLRAAANLGLRYSSNVPGCHEQDIYVSVANKGSWHAIGRQMGAFVMCLYKPYSRGSVAITSSRADDEPSVDFNLLDDERDERRLMEAVRFAAGVYASEPLRRATHAAFPSGLTPRVRALNLVTPWNRFVSGLGGALLDGPAIIRNWLLEHVVNDGPSLADLLADEALLRRWVRQRVIPFYHACGTCRMGAEGDATRVVDEQARVVGIDGLFVVDASVFPSIPRANTNLPTIMLAEKIASASQISPCTSAPS
jgi:5-(hydroxymethyl)furfural/furfural oxidase